MANSTYLANSSIHPLTPEQEQACQPDGGWGTSGLTKREFFASMAMQGMCASGEYAAATGEQIARYSVECADALLAKLIEAPTP